MMEYLSGVNEQELGKAKLLKKAKAAVKKSSAKIKKVVGRVVKISATPVREAFKLLLDVNFFHFAVNFKKALAKDPNKIYALWSKFGGDKKGLDAAIGRGVAHYAKHHKGKVSGCLSGTEDYDGELGVIAAAGITASVAAATPLIVLAKKLLTGIIGHDGTGEASDEDKAVETAGATDFKDGLEQAVATNKQTEDTPAIENNVATAPDTSASNNDTRIPTDTDSPINPPAKPLISPKLKAAREEFEAARKAVVFKKAKVRTKPVHDGYVWYNDKRIWIGTGLGVAALTALLIYLNKNNSAARVRL